MKSCEVLVSKSYLMSQPCRNSRSGCSPLIICAPWRWHGSARSKWNHIRSRILLSSEKQECMYLLLRHFQHKCNRKIFTLLLLIYQHPTIIDTQWGYYNTTNCSPTMIPLPLVLVSCSCFLDTWWGFATLPAEIQQGKHTVLKWALYHIWTHRLFDGNCNTTSTITTRKDCFCICYSIKYQLIVHLMGGCNTHFTLIRFRYKECYNRCCECCSKTYSFTTNKTSLCL